MTSGLETPALVSISVLSESLLALISLLLVLLALLILRGVIKTSVLGDGPDSEKATCENCGAQVDVDEPVCSHCREPLSDDSR